MFSSQDRKEILTIINKTFPNYTINVSWYNVSRNQINYSLIRTSGVVPVKKMREFKNALRLHNFEFKVKKDKKRNFQNSTKERGISYENIYIMSTEG